MNEAGDTQERGPRRKWEMKWGVTEVPVCGRQGQLATELGGLLLFFSTWPVFIYEKM